MKTNTAPQPRFVCRVIRGWRSLFSDSNSGAPRRFDAGHVASCEDCQRFFCACDELDLALKRDATREVQVVPTGLEQRIIRAVNLAAPEPRSRPARYVPFAFVGAA